MDSVSVSEVQELVRQLPEDKLAHAYQLLRELSQERGSSSPQVEFMCLPVNERRRLLSQQAAEMVNHYEQTANERENWQGGDIADEY